MHKIQFTSHCCKTYAECFPATWIFTILLPIVNSVSSTIAYIIRERHITGTQRPFLGVAVCTTTKRIWERLNSRPLLSSSIPSISLHSKTDLHSVCKRNESFIVGLFRHSSRGDRSVCASCVAQCTFLYTKSDRVISLGVMEAEITGFWTKPRSAKFLCVKYGYVGGEASPPSHQTL